MELVVDLAADLNRMDDDGLGWSVLADARHPERVVPGVMLLAVRFLALSLRRAGSTSFVSMLARLQRLLLVSTKRRFGWCWCRHVVMTSRQRDKRARTRSMLMCERAN